MSTAVSVLAMPVNSGMRQRRHQEIIVYGEPPPARTKIVDIPAYSQGPDTPISLLIQLP
jgi:hypothetical protein